MLSLLFFSCFALSVLRTLVLDILLFTQYDILYGDNECDETIEKTIEFRYLKDNISDLMQLIADDELYFEHIHANNE